VIGVSLPYLIALSIRFWMMWSRPSRVPSTAMWPATWRSIRAPGVQPRAGGGGVGRARHRLVGVVAGVQVGEHEHRGPAGDLAVGQLGVGDLGVDGRVVLDRPLIQEAGPAAPRDR